MRPPCVDARAGRRQMDMAVLEVKIYEATLCASRAARRTMEVNNIEVKAFEAISPHEGLRGRKCRCTLLR